MSITVYNRKSTPPRKRKDPVLRLTVCETQGTVSFSIAFCELVGLEVGNGVVFIHDEEKSQWYLSIGNYPNAYRVREAASLRGNKYCSIKRVQCRSLTRLILSDTGQVRSARFLIGRKTVKINGMTCYPILTKNPLPVKYA